MKVKLAICLCAVLMPFLAIADEAVVDNRHYLEQSEYGIAPHKFVLLMKSRGRNHCTANLVQVGEAKKIITARHCLGSCDDGASYEFYTLNGQTVSAKVDSDSCGNFDREDADTISGDYAILTPTPTSGMDALEFGTICTGNINSRTTGVMTGYGVLKPLEAPDVTHFIHAYLRFLFDAEMGLPVGTSKDANVNDLNSQLTQKGVHDVSSEGGHTGMYKNMCATDFMSSASYYDIEVDEWFNDVHPKTRECTVVDVAYGGFCRDCIKLDCNAWQGDSGAGFWVKKGENDYCFAGVLSQGFDDIGGVNSIGNGTVQVAPASNMVLR